MSDSLAAEPVPADRRALVAVDLGAESCRVSLLRWQEGKPQVALIQRFDNKARQMEGGLRWDDPALGIDWPAPRGAVSVNDRDRNWPAFAEVMAGLKAPA